MALIEEQHVVTVQGAAYGMGPYFPPFLRHQYGTPANRLRSPRGLLRGLPLSCSAQIVRAKRVKCLPGV